MNQLLHSYRADHGLALDESGCGLEYYRMLSILRRGGGLLEGCVAGVVDCSTATELTMAPASVRRPWLFVTASMMLFRSSAGKPLHRRSWTYLAWAGRKRTSF